MMTNYEAWVLPVPGHEDGGLAFFRDLDESARSAMAKMGRCVWRGRAPNDEAAKTVFAEWGRANLDSTINAEQLSVTAVERPQ